MKPRQYPEQMLKTLVRKYEISADAEVRAWGMKGRELAVEAGIFSAEAMERCLKGYEYDYIVCDYAYSVNNPDVELAKEINGAAEYMKDKGWISISSAGENMGEEGVYSWLKPTPTGIDYAHELMRPWYRKVWDLLKGDIRTIVVAIITATIVTLLANLVLRLFG